MKKYVVIGIDKNPIYRYYLPLVTWAWNYFGWDVLVLRAEDYPIGYRSAMVAQVSRLYAALLVDPVDSYLMTADADMLPLSNYWKPNFNCITSWGHDLTNYQHYPMCYIGMNGERWLDVMGLKEGASLEALMEFDLNNLPQAKCGDPIKEWVVDQDLITERIKTAEQYIHRVERGVYINGYPIGRVDRSAWLLDHEQLIDAHLFHNPNKEQKEKIKQLLKLVWPFEKLDHFIC